MLGRRLFGLLVSVCTSTQTPSAKHKTLLALNKFLSAMAAEDLQELLHPQSVSRFLGDLLGSGDAIVVSGALCMAVSAAPKRWHAGTLDKAASSLWCRGSPPEPAPRVRHQRDGMRAHQTGFKTISFVVPQDILMDRLSGMFRDCFVREGVVHQVRVVAYSCNPDGESLLQLQLQSLWRIPTAAVSGPPGRGALPALHAANTDYASTLWP